MENTPDDLIWPNLADSSQDEESLPLENFPSPDPETISKVDRFVAPSEVNPPQKPPTNRRKFEETLELSRSDWKAPGAVSKFASDAPQSGSSSYDSVTQSPDVESQFSASEDADLHGWSAAEYSGVGESENFEGSHISSGSNPPTLSQPLYTRSDIYGSEYEEDLDPLDAPNQPNFDDEYGDVGSSQYDQQYDRGQFQSGYGMPSGEHQDLSGYGDEEGLTAGFDEGYGDDLYDDDELESEDSSDSASLSAAEARRNMIEWVVVLVAAVVASLLIRAFLVQAFHIPSESMESTLMVRDRVMVNKLSYRFGDIEHGEIVVFSRTEEELAQLRRERPSEVHHKDLIKRVIALGGETVERRDNKVCITRVGGTIPECLNEEYLDEGTINKDFPAEVVPDGHIFVMGDHREASDDSTQTLGPIDEDQVVGRAFVLFWPVSRFSAL